MIPRPVDPAEVTLPTECVARLALGASWRLRAFAHSLAHGLRRVPSSGHRAVASRIDACLAASDRFRLVPGLAAAGGDPERLVEARLNREPIPSCASWAEVACADVLFGGALEAAIASLAGSSDDAIAAAARDDLGLPFGEAVLDALAADPPNRACLQLLVDRWTAHAVRAFGLPGSPADAELVVRRVKTRAAGESLLSWLSAIERRMEPWQLCLPDAQFMGVEIPGNWTPSRRPKGRH